MKINGGALDTRLRSALLTDHILLTKLTGEEFRSFVCLMVFVVTKVSDGLFYRDELQLVPAINPDHLAAMAAIGVIEQRGKSDSYRINSEYWDWQSSKEELEKQENKKAADRVRHQKPPSNTK